MVAYISAGIFYDKIIPAQKSRKFRICDYVDVRLLLKFHSLHWCNNF